MASNVPNEPEAQDEASLESKMEAQKEKLQEIVESEFGLLADLISSKTLTINEKKKIEAKGGTTSDKNEMLLGIVLSKHKHQEFLEGLRISGQMHVVNWIERNGVYGTEVGLLWPLLENHIEILSNNYKFLSENLNAKDDLSGELFSRSVINKRQRDFINSKATVSESNEAFLDMLTRFSLEAYLKVAECLRELNCGHIAEALEKVVVPVHVKTEGQNRRTEEIDAKVVKEITKILIQRDPSLEGTEIARVFGLLQLSIIAAREGNSIILYLCCPEVQEFHHLCTIVDSDEAKEILEQLFNLLLQNLQMKVLLVTIAETDREKAEKVFQREAMRDKTFDEHFRELRSQLKYEKPLKVTAEAEEVDEEEEQEQESEQSSERDFTSEAEERREAEADLMKVGVLQSSASRTAFEILAAILRNNFDYFVEFIVPKGLIDRLHAEECITDEETRYIKTLTNDRDKNDEIVKCVRGVLEKYDVFVDILREKNQYRIAEVAEKGGAVMRVSITFKKHSDSEKIQEELSERICGHLSKAGPFQTGVVEVTSLLARARIEIVEAKSSRNLLLWLWCRSEDALKKFDKMNESQEEELSKFFGEFFALLLDDGEHVPPILSIDLDDPDRDVVLRPRGFTLEGNLATSKHSVCAVTSFEDDIYVLSKNPNAILIFAIDDVNNVRKTVPISDVKDPVDLVAVSEIVYVSDAGNSCIWEISLAHNRVSSWMQSVGAPYTMSLMEDGTILKVSQGQPSTLDVYDTGSKQLSVIPLPSSIRFPWHAVGTSAKTFVVSYGEKVGVSTALCEVNSVGDIMNVFDLSIKSAPGAGAILNRSLLDLIGSSFEKGYPCLFTLNERDEVFAIDHSNAGILVYNSRLMLEEIHGRHSIKNPSDIHYMKSKNLLLVVHGESESAVVILQQKWS